MIGLGTQQQNDDLFLARASESTVLIRNHGRESLFEDSLFQEGALLDVEMDQQSVDGAKG